MLLNFLKIVKLCFHESCDWTQYLPLYILVGFSLIYIYPIYSSYKHIKYFLKFIYFLDDSGSRYIQPLKLVQLII